MAVVRELTARELTDRGLSDRRSTGQRAHRRPRSDEVVVSAAIVGLSLATLVILFLPGLSFAAIAPSADLILNTVAVTIAGGVAGLAWIRFREARQAHELFQASAFLSLAAGGLIALALTATGLGDRYGFNLGSAGQAPFYLWDLQRLTAGVLFLVGGWVGFRDPQRTIRRPFLVLLGPPGLLVLLSGLVLLLANELPRAWIQDEIALLASGPQVIDLSQLNPGIAAVELGIALMFVLSAALFRRTYLKLGQRSLIYLVVGLIVAATAQVHSIFVPTSFSGVVTSVDLFRVTFYAVLLVGVATGTRADLRTLRQANDEVRALRDADVRAAALKERSRLAREMHDGLIQDLWLARLKAGHLLGVSHLPKEGQALADEVDRALEVAMSEARLALESLTAAPDSQGSLPGSLARLVEEMSDRLEPELALELAPDLAPVSNRVEVELLRIVREAIMNGGKHADATLIRVTGHTEDGLIRLEVADNGTGFDTHERVPGFGLRSMRERADLIGATLTIESRPHDGTRVGIALPLDPSARVPSGRARDDRGSPASTPNGEP